MAEPAPVPTSPATGPPETGQPAADSGKPGAPVAKPIPDKLDSVKVYSPFKIYYDSPATSVSAQNATGPFDILPGHKNFMTLLTPGEIVIRTPGGEEHIRIESAIMHVSNNVVKVFLDV